MLPKQKGTAFAQRVVQIAARIIDKFYRHPKRRRELKGKASSFVHKTEDGLYFRIDPKQYIDRHIFVEGIYEKRFLAFMQDLLPRGGVALDIGANIGNHALYLSRSLSRIHCFEPNPDTCRRLLENIELNKTSNILTHSIGLGDQNAILHFQINLDGNLGASGYVDHSEKRHQNTEIIKLPIARGDDYIEDLKISTIDFIKIDVEGFELKVLTGLQSTIAKHRPIISFEFHGQNAQPDEFSSIRKALPEYHLFELLFSPEQGTIIQKIRWQLRHGEKPALAPLNTPEAKTYENIIALPFERLSQIPA